MEVLAAVLIAFLVLGTATVLQLRSLTTWAEGMFADCEGDEVPEAASV